MPNIEFNISKAELGFDIKRQSINFDINAVPVSFENITQNLVFDIAPQPIEFKITGGIVNNIVETIVQEEEVPYTKQVDWLDDNTAYIGQADPGTLTSAPAWRIKKVQFITDVDGNEDSTETWADGVGTFTKVWDNRATYTYS